MKKLLILFLCLTMALSMALVAQAEDPAIYTDLGDALVLNVTEQAAIDKYWVWNSYATTHEVVDGAWKITFDGSTWWTTPDCTNALHVDLAEYPVYGIRYKAENMDSPQVIFYQFTKESQAANSHQADIKFSNLVADGAWHTSIVNMDGHSSLKGVLEVMRFDVLDASTKTTGVFYVDAIILAKTKQACAEALGENETSVAPDNGWTEEEALVKTDDLVAFRMGSQYMIKDYFGWDSANCTTSVKDKTWKIDMTGDVAIADLSNKLRVDLDSLPFMAVRYRVENMTSAKMQFYSWTDVRESTGEERLDLALNCDGDWHVGMIDNRENPYMEDILNLLRIDVAGKTGGTVYVDYIVFAKTEAVARAFDEDGEFPAETFQPSLPEDTEPVEDTETSEITQTEPSVNTTVTDTEDMPAQTTVPAETEPTSTTAPVGTDVLTPSEPDNTLAIVIVISVAAVLVALILVIGLRKKKN